MNTWCSYENYLNVCLDSDSSKWSVDDSWFHEFIILLIYFHEFLISYSLKSDEVKEINIHVLYWARTSARTARRPAGPESHIGPHPTLSQTNVDTYYLTVRIHWISQKITIKSLISLLEVYTECRFILQPRGMQHDANIGMLHCCNCNFSPGFPHC